jgi:hypothetical protein
LTLGSTPAHFSVLVWQAWSSSLSAERTRTLSAKCVRLWLQQTWSAIMPLGAVITAPRLHPQQDIANLCAPCRLQRWYVTLSTYTSSESQSHGIRCWFRFDTLSHHRQPLEWLSTKPVNNTVTVRPRNLNSLRTFRLFCKCAKCVGQPTVFSSASVAPGMPAAMQPAGRYLIPDNSKWANPCMVKRGYDKLDSHFNGASLISLIRM